MLTLITRLAAILMVLASLLCAQQSVDPTGACPNNSSATIIAGQTDHFICAPTAPGAAAGIWTALSKFTVRVAYARYVFATDGGAVSTITPSVNSTIPAKAIVFGVIANSTTALTSGGAATIAIGTSAGSSTTALKTATAVASYSADALLPGAPVFTAGSAVKLSAAGTITLTVATAALTAGVLDVFAFYVIPN